MISIILNKLNSVKKFPFYILTPIVYAIGTASEEILVAIQKAKELDKKILIITPDTAQNFLKYNVCNNFLFTHLKINDYLQNDNKITKNFFKFFIELEFLFLRIFILFLEKLIKNFKIEKFRFPRIGINFSYSKNDINQGNFMNQNFDDISPLILNKNKIQVNLDNQYLSKIKKIHNFDFLEPYVCIQVRDSAYYNDGNRKNYRNSNVENYYDLINYLLSKNYKVIRMGTKVNHKLKLKNKNLIDYPYSDFNHKYLDLYLIQNCNFFVGTSSGLIDVAWLFNRPVLLTNMVNIFSGLPRNQSDRGLFKKIYKQSGEELTLREYISLPFAMHNLDLNIKNLNFRENTKEELYTAIHEFNEIIEKKTTNELNKKQILFNELVIFRLKELFYDRKEKNCLINYHACLNMLRMTKSCKGSLLSFYLNKNFN